MEHGQTWFSLLPGVRQIGEFLQSEAAWTLFAKPEKIVFQHVAAAMFVVLIMLLISIRARIDLARSGQGGLIPDPNPSVRNFLEVSLEWLYAQAQTIIGKDAKRYFPVIGALGMFIFISNMLGLVPGFAPPTDNWNTTFGCSLFVFLYYNYHGLRAHGLGHIAHMANPAGLWWGWFLAPLLFPIEIVSHLSRPFSLAVRLAANMMGDHAVITAFLGLVPVLIPLPFMVLGLIVCTVQTMVFVLLTTIYIGLATAESHAEEHQEAAHAAA